MAAENGIAGGGALVFHDGVVMFPHRAAVFDGLSYIKMSHLGDCTYVRMNLGDGTPSTLPWPQQDDSSPESWVSMAEEAMDMDGA